MKEAAGKWLCSVSTDAWIIIFPFIPFSRVSEAIVKKESWNKMATSFCSFQRETERVIEDEKRRTPNNRANVSSFEVENKQLWWEDVVTRISTQFTVNSKRKLTRKVVVSLYPHLEHHLVFRSSFLSFLWNSFLWLKVAALFLFLFLSNSVLGPCFQFWLLFRYRNNSCEKMQLLSYRKRRFFNLPSNANTKLKRERHWREDIERETEGKTAKNRL